MCVTSCWKGKVERKVQAFNFSPLTVLVGGLPCNLRRFLRWALGLRNSQNGSSSKKKEESCHLFDPIRSRKRRDPKGPETRPESFALNNARRTLLVLLLDFYGATLNGVTSENRITYSYLIFILYRRYSFTCFNFYTSLN